MNKFLTATAAFFLCAAPAAAGTWTTNLTAEDMRVRTNGAGIPADEGVGITDTTYNGDGWYAGFKSYWGNSHRPDEVNLYAALKQPCGWGITCTAEVRYWGLVPFSRISGDAFDLTFEGSAALAKWDGGSVTALAHFDELAYINKPDSHVIKTLVTLNQTISPGFTLQATTGISNRLDLGRTHLPFYGEVRRDISDVVPGLSVALGAEGFYILDPHTAFDHQHQFTIAGMLNLRWSTQ